MRRLVVLCCVLCFSIGPKATANVYADHMMALAERELMQWLTDPDLIAGLRAQNAEHESLTRSDLRALDREWRREIGAAHTPLIDRVLSTEISVKLRQVQADAGGLISEIIIMDNRGLH